MDDPVKYWLTNEKTASVNLRFMMFKPKYVNRVRHSEYLSSQNEIPVVQYCSLILNNQLKTWLLIGRHPTAVTLVNESIRDEQLVVFVNFP